MQSKEVWSSRWGLVFALLGAAIGTGNIWRFPKEVAANGGGAFLIPFIIFLFTWSIPLLIAEFCIGKNTCSGTLNAFKKFVGNKYVFMGAWMVCISILIEFYYAVIMGWIIKYLWCAMSGRFTAGVNTESLWNSFITSPQQVIFFQFTAVLISAYIVYKGITKGIEKVNMIVIPILFIFLTILAIRALTLPGAINGLKFLYIPQWEYLCRGETWIRALAQCAWSCSAGMGMAITYAAYMRAREDTNLNAFITGFGDTAASLIASIAVICTVFGLTANTSTALHTMESQSFALTFVHLTNLFAMMPGGTIMAVIFFFALLVAALTSSISGFEIATKNFIDAGWSREKAVKFISIAVFFGGIPSAVIITYGIYGNLAIPTFLEHQDLIWGLALMVSGLFVAFAVWKFGIESFRRQFVNTKWSDIKIGRWWSFAILLFPIQFIFLITWFFYDTLKSNPWIFVSMLIHWIVLGVILVKFNKFFVKKLEV